MFEYLGVSEIFWISPLRSTATFLGRICTNFAGKVKNSKNRIPLFVFLLSKRNNEDIPRRVFSRFFTVHVSYTTEDDQMLIVHRKWHKDFRSVDIFGLSLTDFE
jgi:hypothetical protein